MLHGHFRQEDPLDYISLVGCSLTPPEKNEIHLRNHHSTGKEHR